MSIRANKNTKNQLPQRGEPSLVLVETPSTPPDTEDLLRFHTSHPKKPCFVDLTVFRDGKPNSARSGGFRGRPQLIEELAPAIRDQFSPLAEKSVGQYLVALRSWWRILDAVEKMGSSMPVVTSVAQLSDIHRQCAFDAGMDRLVFSNFMRIANTTRLGLSLNQLHWKTPEPKESSRHLPPKWQTDLVRHTLKHRWFATLNRWALADELRHRGAPLIEQEASSIYPAGLGSAAHAYAPVQPSVLRSGTRRQ